MNVYCVDYQKFLHGKRQVVINVLYYDHISEKELSCFLLYSIMSRNLRCIM